MFDFFAKRLFKPNDVNKNATPGKIIQSYFSSSGVRVTADTALKLGAVWRAVDLISGSVGRMPCHLFRTDGNSIARARDDYRFNILWREPSEGVSAFTFFQTMTAHVVLRGNAYAYISRNGDRTISELWIIPPEYVKPVRRDGKIFYLIKLDDQEAVSVPYYDMIHIKGMGYDGTVGYSVIEYFATDGGLAQAMRDYSAEFFSNGAVVDMVVAPKEHLGKVEFEALRQSWREGYTGKGNRHKTAVSPDPLDVQTITINARDAQLIESRELSVREIANWFGVPPHKIGDNSRTAYNSIEAENMSFLSDCLDRHLISFEQEFHIKLLTEEEKRAGSLYFEFNRASALRGDTASRYEAFYKAVGGPWMTPNEARKLENFNPIDGGEILLKPNNMTGNGDKTNEKTVA